MSDKNYSTKLREIYTPDIIDEVVSFANGDGGVLYIGIREDSAVLGISNPEETAARAARDIVSAVQPDISPILQVRTVQLRGKDLVAVMVGRGTDKPYSRIGAEPVPEPLPEQSGEQPKPAAHPLFGFSETAPCPDALTFSTLGYAMEACEIPADNDTLRSLGILTESGFTGLALLLSEQCPYTVRVTQYDGIDKASIKYSGTVGGSLLRQLAETCRLVERLAPERFPSDALSEAVLNSLTHRSYSHSGSTQVSIFSDRLEIVSLGGLPDGLTMAAVDMGISQPRYPRLAEVLCRLELAECCGSGIARIRSLYAAQGKEAGFTSVDGAFRVVLPDLLTETKRSTPPDGYKALVLRLAREKGFVVRSDVEQLAGLKTTAAYNLIKELVEDGLLTPSGVGKKTIYKVFSDK